MSEQSGVQENLQALVYQAEHLLACRSKYFTDGAQLALMDAVKDAKAALEGKQQVPFVRNRAFYTPREEEGVLFATKRYTMAPSYLERSSVYSSYGLEPALEWFKQQDMMRNNPSELVEKAKLVTAKAEELLSSATIGQTIGNYSLAAGKQLESALKQVRLVLRTPSTAEHSEQLACAIVVCFNKLREFRYSKVLRTEVDASANLYLTREALLKLRRTVGTDAIVGKQYEQIKNLADSLSLDYIEKAAMIMNEDSDYGRVNEEFYVWSSTDKIINFTPPSNAVKATLSFILPCEENELEGLGHAWIDELEILSASAGNLEIMNSGFDDGNDQPDHWKFEARKGNPVYKWEDIYPYCGGKKSSSMIVPNPSLHADVEQQENCVYRSLYLCNPTSKDEGAWVYDKDIAVVGGVGYTLTFAAKIDGKLKKGLKTMITFKDEADQEAGSFEYYFNRKSSLANSSFQLTMQCDAIQYAITDDETYAVKAKKEILYNLNDFCQGAEHWLVTNERPGGSDSYGAVQGGRMLCCIAVSYSLIKEADIFTAAEKESFYEMIEYMLRYMLDLRDRTELTPEEAQDGCSNWQTDMCAGVGYMMMALEDFPYRKTWLYNANMVLKSQLQLNVNQDNSWPESIRYHHAALERFAGYAKVLKHVTGENWFQTTPLSGMFDYGIHMQTPGYVFFGGRIGTPPFGDHALGGGAEFGSFEIYLTEIEQVDKSLADRMYHCWKMAGSPLKGLWGEAVALENILGAGGSYTGLAQLTLESNKNFADAGLYIFRKNFPNVNQSYFAIMSSPRPISHGHLDQGSFILYKNSIPMVMDSGIEGYFDSTTSWHLSSYSHACMQFSTKQIYIERPRSPSINLSAGTYSLERGWVDVPRTSKVLECTLGEVIDFISIEILNPEGEGRHIREVHYIKEPDLYIIRDTVHNFEGEVLFNLPVASQNSVIEEQRIMSSGVYDVNLETVFLNKLKGIWLDKGRSIRFFDNKYANLSMMDYIRATADAKEGFLTLLYPHVKGQNRLEIVREAEHKWRVSAGGTSVCIGIEEAKISIRVANLKD